MPGGLYKHVIGSGCMKEFEFEAHIAQTCSTILCYKTVEYEPIARIPSLSNPDFRPKIVDRLRPDCYQRMDHDGSAVGIRCKFGDTCDKNVQYSANKTHGIPYFASRTQVR